MEIALVHRRILLVNHLPVVEDDAAIDRAIIDELTKCLARPVVLLQLELADLRPERLRQLQHRSVAPHHGGRKDLRRMEINPVGQRTSLIPIRDRHLPANRARRLRPHLTCTRLRNDQANRDPQQEKNSAHGEWFNPNQPANGRSFSLLKNANASRISSFSFQLSVRLRQISISVVLLSHQCAAPNLRLTAAFSRKNIASKPTAMSSRKSWACATSSLPRSSLSSAPRGSAPRPSSARRRPLTGSSPSFYSICRSPPSLFTLTASCRWKAASTSGPSSASTSSPASSSPGTSGCSALAS